MQSDERLKEELEKLGATYTASFNRQDAASIAVLYADGGRHINSLGPRADIEELYHIQGRFRSPGIKCRCRLALGKRHSHRDWTISNCRKGSSERTTHRARRLLDRDLRSRRRNMENWDANRNFKIDVQLQFDDRQSAIDRPGPRRQPRPSRPDAGCCRIFAVNRRAQAARPTAPREF